MECSELILDGIVTRAQVEQLQGELMKLPQYEPQTKHYFHGGMYCREVYRKAGVVVVGRVHRKEHFYIIASGQVAITTDEGTQILSAPAVIKSRAGTKRAVLSLMPTTCMTFHRTDATTVEEAELELVEQEPSMYDARNQLLDRAEANNLCEVG